MPNPRISQVVLPHRIQTLRDEAATGDASALQRPGQRAAGAALAMGSSEHGGHPLDGNGSHEAIATYQAQTIASPQGERVAGIDLGEVHMAAAHDGTDTHILNGESCGHPCSTATSCKPPSIPASTAR